MSSQRVAATSWGWLAVAAAAEVPQCHRGCRLYGRVCSGRPARDCTARMVMPWPETLCGRVTVSHRHSPTLPLGTAMVVEGQQGSDAVVHLGDAMTVGHRTDVMRVGALLLAARLVVCLARVACHARASSAVTVEALSRRQQDDAGPTLAP